MTKRNEKRQIMELLSVATPGSVAMPEGLAGEVASAVMDGFGPWSTRRRHGDMLRRCGAAVVLSVLLCSYASASAPPETRLAMALNDRADRMQAVENVYYVLNRDA